VYDVQHAGEMALQQVKMGESNDGMLQWREVAYDGEQAHLTARAPVGVAVLILLVVVRTEAEMTQGTSCQGGEAAHFLVQL
jgi:hypothetical protein